MSQSDEGACSVEELSGEEDAQEIADRMGRRTTGSGQRGWKTTTAGRGGRNRGPTWTVRDGPRRAGAEEYRIPRVTRDTDKTSTWAIMLHVWPLEDRPEVGGTFQIKFFFCLRALLPFLANLVLFSITGPIRRGNKVDLCTGDNA